MMYGVCADPVVTRSWDGGKTWTLEHVDAPNYSISGIVRLQGGVLLTSFNGVRDGFIISDDGGRVWRPLVDSLLSEQPPFVLSHKLYRDYRGMVYWIGSGALFSSLDNGKTFLYLKGARAESGVYVLPPHGWIVAHSVASGDHSAPVQMSYDHGRSFTTIAEQKQEHIKFWEYDNINVIRDTLTIDETINDPFLPGPSIRRTLYWQQDSKSWREGRYLGDCSLKDGVMDSSDCWYGWHGTGVGINCIGDTTCTRLVVLLQPDSLPPADTSVFYEYVPMQGIYYDLDGAVHPHGSLISLPINKPRPISRIDRLYTCSGVEYVVGGHRLDSVILDHSRSNNAQLTYTITPNRRLSTVVINAIDSMKPMYFSMLVGDGIVGAQRFTDSVLPILSRPVIRERVEGATTSLEAGWSDGPFMWLRDGQPVPLRSVGVNGTTSVQAPTPGTYKVLGKTPFGCDVFSNEIVITTTAVVENFIKVDDYVVYADGDGSLHVRWSVGRSSPESIRLFDILGRQVEFDLNISDHEAVLTPHQSSAIVYVAMTTNQHTSFIGIWHSR
ncbi:MAG: hypothetical protein SGJ05_05225 [bacterium]|nr:hypothetical protein [bacterium]